MPLLCGPAYATLDAIIKLNKITRAGDDVLLQAQAEDAARAIAHGAGFFSSEDVQLLTTYARIAPSWYADEKHEPLKIRYEALMAFIRETEIAEHKEQLIETARLHGHQRCYLALMNTSIYSG